MLSVSLGTLGREEGGQWLWKGHNDLAHGLEPLPGPSWLIFPFCALEVFPFPSPCRDPPSLGGQAQLP